MMTTPEVTSSNAVSVRYFAGAQAAAGIPGETVVLANPATVADLVAVLTATHGPELARVLEAASFIVDARPAADPTTTLPDGATVDVLPPFAGG